VYHIFDPTIRGECDPAAWEEQISMREMVLDPAALAAAVKGIRAQYSRNAPD
jgi:betaine reductase